MLLLLLLRPANVRSLRRHAVAKGQQVVIDGGRHARRAACRHGLVVGRQGPGQIVVATTFLDGTKERQGGRILVAGLFLVGKLWRRRRRLWCWWWWQLFVGRIGRRGLFAARRRVGSVGRQVIIARQRALLSSIGGWLVVVVVTVVGFGGNSGCRCRVRHGGLPAVRVRVAEQKCRLSSC